MFKVAKGVLIVSTGVLWYEVLVRGILHQNVFPSSGYSIVLSFFAFVCLFALIISAYYKSNAMAVIGAACGLLAIPYLAAMPLSAGSRIIPIADAIQSPLFQFQGNLLVASMALFALGVLASVAYVGRALGLRLRKREGMIDRELLRYDFIANRMVHFGFCTMTLGMAILSYWQSEAWSTLWSFDRADTCLLVGWIVYAIYIHLHACFKWRSAATAPVAIIGFFVTSMHYMAWGRLSGY